MDLSAPTTDTPSGSVRGTAAKTHKTVKTTGSLLTGFGQKLYCHYIKREGRSTRQQFLITLLPLLATVLFCAILITAFLPAPASRPEGIKTAMLLVLGMGLLFQRPFQAVYTKRLHDLNRTGWLFFAAYLTLYLNTYLIGRTMLTSTSEQTLFANSAVLFSCMLALGYILSLTLLLAGKQGSEGGNYYGPDPLSPTPKK